MLKVARMAMVITMTRYDEDLIQVYSLLDFHAAEEETYEITNAQLVKK